MNYSNISVKVSFRYLKLINGCIRNICDNYKLWQLPLVVLFRFFAITTFDCLCMLCACVGVRMRICVHVFFLLSLILSTILSMLLYFWTTMVYYSLCFNVCSALEYCYRYQRFINKLLLLLLLLLLTVEKLENLIVSYLRSLRSGEAFRNDVTKHTIWI